MSLLRLRAWIAGLWAGGLVTIALVVAPTLFARLERALAGQAAGDIFRLEARVSLVLAVVLLLIERANAGRRAEAGEGSRFSAELTLILGAIACTVVGAFVIQPMMQQARLGQIGLSFAALHVASTVFYALKSVLVLALAWRASPR